ncbi:hypothetical protein JMM81_06680 [Bacillus sp. V3B]|nr:hypothetical protein [Bacillus sp. V3B]
MEWNQQQHSQSPNYNSTPYNSNSSPATYYPPHATRQQNANQDAEALRLAIANWSAFLNRVAMDPKLAVQVVSLMNAGDVTQLNALIVQLGLEGHCYFTQHGFCCKAAGKTVCMRITIS